MATSRNPVVKALRGDTLMRSVKTNRSELARSVIKQARRKPLYSPGGIYLGSPYTAPIEGERLESSFKNIARGLYYHVRKTPLPPEAILHAFRVDSFSLQNAWDEMSRSGAAMKGIHSQVFACQYVFDDKDQTFSRWLLLFYNTILIEVMSMPSNWFDTLVSEVEQDEALDSIAPSPIANGGDVAS